jgi:ABC-type transporter Mla MlaB component
MGFELVIAVKRDPLDREGVANDAAPAHAPYTSIALNGIATSAAAQEVVDKIDELFEAGTECIIVELQSIEASDLSGLAALAEGIMKIRARGRQVQLLAHDRALHERLVQMPKARDWLMPFTEPKVSGARRSIHVDRASTDS